MKGKNLVRVGKQVILAYSQGKKRSVLQVLVVFFQHSKQKTMPK